MSGLALASGRSQQPASGPRSAKLGCRQAAAACPLFHHMENIRPVSVARSPLPVLRENVIFCLCNRMAREPALGVVLLRRLVSRGLGREGVGCGVIFELG